jgi:hypothetical protein
MHETRQSSSSGDVVMEVASLSTGLGVVTVTLFPFAFPALLLALPLVLLAAPLALAAGAVLLLAGVLVLPFRLARSAVRRRSRRRPAAGPAGGAPSLAAGGRG